MPFAKFRRCCPIPLGLQKELLPGTSTVPSFTLAHITVLAVALFASREVLFKKY